MIKLDSNFSEKNQFDGGNLDRRKIRFFSSPLGTLQQNNQRKRNHNQINNNFECPYQVFSGKGGNKFKDGFTKTTMKDVMNEYMNEGRKEGIMERGVYLRRTAHFIYGYMASDI